MPMVIRFSEGLRTEGGTPINLIDSLADTYTCFAYTHDSI